MTIVPRLVARTATLLAALVGAALIAMSLAPSAEAASGYRFWGYYQLKDGKWAMASKGAAQVTPKNGDVEGWRYALAGQTDSRTPRDTISFEEICGGGPKAEKGNKLVGLVIDFGRKADAASGTPPTPSKVCAEAPQKATGAEVLAAGLKDNVRIEKGMTCGILGWPKTGCSDEVKDIPAAAAAKDKPIDISAQLGFSSPTASGPTDAGSENDGSKPSASSNAAAPASDSEDDSSNTPLLIGGGIVVLLLLGGGLVLAARRRKSVESA